MRKNLKLFAVLLIVVSIGAGGLAHAERLQVDPEAPLWAHAGAALLLYLHIGGGAVGLLAGASAVLSRKGAAVHRAAGKVFFVSMFISYLIGAGVAPFLTTGQRPNFTAGVLALYLLVTGVMAARRRVFEAGRAEWVGMGLALVITGLGVLFMIMGANSDSGTVDGSPPQAFYIFIAAGSAAFLGETHAIVRRRLSETARVVRHLWRMCFAFFIGTGSLFLGQPQVFPDWFNQTFLPYALAFFPLLFLFIWAIRVRFWRMETKP